MEDGGIRCFVQGPDPRHRESFSIDLPQDLSKHHNSVEAVHAKQPNLLWRGRGTMVGIVKQHLVSECLSKVQQSVRQRRRIPFMYQQDVEIFQRLPPGIDGRYETRFIQLNSQIWVY